MKNSIKFWNLKFMTLGIILVVSGLYLISNDFTMKSSIIVSILALFVGLIVCCCIKPVRNNVKVCGVPFITENFGDVNVNYSIPGVSGSDVTRSLEFLEHWKTENHFEWINNRNKTLIVIFNDVSKNQLGVIEIDNNSPRDVKEYTGVFRYYMEGEGTKVRKIKVDDIQLGALDAGIIEDINTYANKKCHLSVIGNTIVECSILEG